MLDIKSWLDGTGIKFEQAAWKKTPAYPYGVFLDESESSGADEKLFIKEHDINIEIYSDTEKGIASAEKKIDKFLQDSAIVYTCFGREWDDQEKHFRNSYYFSIKEKLED